MKKFTGKDLVAAVIWFIPLFYLAWVYPSLPNTVALHFNLHGQPDRYGDKSEFLFIAFLLSGVSLLLYVLLKYVPNFDPKKKAKYSQDTFSKMAMVLMIFLGAINTAIIYTTAHNGFDIAKFMFPMIGLMFVYLGNMMHSIKPNYFVGIRTPWTLEDEDTWRETHRLGGKMFFTAGILIIIATLLLPDKAGFIVFISLTIISALVPCIYSYTYYKKHKQ